MKPHRTAAFSLIELIMTMGVMAVLLAAVAAAMSIARKAAPAPDDGGAGVLAIRAAAAEIAAEVATATSITAATATSIEFTVPDRNKDGLEETIRYSWSGAEGDPLRRRQNSDAWEKVLTATDFRIALQTRREQDETQGAPAAGTVQLLSAFTGPHPATFRLRSSQMAAQCITPRLPADAVAYTPTRVRLHLQQDGNTDGTLQVSLHRDSGGAPGVQLATASLRENVIPAAGGWVSFDLPSAALNPGDPVWIRIAPTTLGSSTLNALLGILLPASAGQVSTASSGVANAREFAASSSNNGFSWAPGTDASIAYELYGTVTRPQSVAVNRRRAVMARIIITGADGLSAAGAARLPASPAIGAGVVADATPDPDVPEAVVIAADAVVADDGGGK